MLRKLFHRLRGSLRRGKIESELDRELRIHLEMETAENMRRGMSEEDARRAALRNFGGVERVKEAYRDVSRFRRLEDLWQDLRYGARMLRKNPGFTVVAVLTLALGIGANTAIFSVVNVVLLKPVPYYAPQRLVWVTMEIKGDDYGHVAAQPYLNWQAESKSLEHLVAFIGGTLNWTGGDGPQPLSGVLVTANTFSALGVAPQLGRAFTPEEDRPGGERVALLSHAFWARSFGGDPDIIGQSLTLDGQSRTVIGIMPPGFRFLQDGRFLGEIDVWAPLALDVERELKADGSINVNVLGRLKPGFTPEQARAELTLLLRQVYPKIPDGVVQAKVKPLLLFGVFAAVALALAAVGVYGVISHSVSRRTHEIGIRMALGARPRDALLMVIRQGMLLTLTGVAIGLAAALALARVMAGLFFDVKATDPATFAGVSVLLVGIAFLATYLPARRATKVDPMIALRQE